MVDFGDIWDGVERAGSAVANTGETFVRATTAPVTTPIGLLYDIATSPNDIGSDVLQAAGGFLTDVTGPLVDQQSLTGMAIMPVMKAMDDAFREGISEPVSTALTAWGHAWEAQDPASLFSEETWQRAYDTAQHRSMGQSWFTAGMASAEVLTPIDDLVDDPLYEDAYDNLHSKAPMTTSIVTGSVDATARWYLDPGVIAGKTVGAARWANKYRPLSSAEGNIASKLAETEKSRKVLGVLPSKGLATRYDELFGRIDDGVYTPGVLDGKSTSEIYRMYTPFQANPYGWTQASLLSDAGKIENVSERINAQRRIMALLNGDVETAAQFTGRRDYIIHMLENIKGKKVIDAEVQEMSDYLLTHYAIRGQQPKFFPYQLDPNRVKDAEDQIDALPKLTEFLQSERTRMDQLLQQFRMMPDVMVPGAREIRRSVRDTTGRGLTRTGELNTGVQKIDEAAEKVLGPLRHGFQSVHQFSPDSMPLRVVWSIAGKPIVKAGDFAAGTAKVPSRIYDSFRDVRPEGWVNLSDTDDVIRQMDAFMRHGGIDPVVRTKFMDDMAATSHTYERIRVFERAETEVQKNLMHKYGALFDEMNANDLDSFLGAINGKGLLMRQAWVKSQAGRAYSATRRPDGTRVDWVDEEGAWALPFLETQDATMFPLLDIVTMDKFISKNSGLIRATARQWKSDYGTGIASPVKRAAGEFTNTGVQGFDRLADGAIHSLDFMNRMWKFSVLARLGYPTRVIADSQMRATAALGSTVLVNALKEGMPNYVWNHSQRYDDIVAAGARLRMRQSELELLFDNPAVYERNQQIWTRIREIDKKLRRVKSQSKIDDLTAEREVLIGREPEDLLPLRQELDKVVSLRQSKAYIKEIKKRRMGEGEITMPDGTKVPDIFNGTYGDLIREITGSRASYNRLGDTIESNLYNQFRRIGSQREVVPSEGGIHLHSWAHALNYQLRTSKLAQIVLKGGDSDDVLKFLTKTPQGREIAYKLPYRGGDPESWAVDVERMVHQYAPTPELRQTLLERNVSAKELDTLFRDVNSRPVVHGGLLDSNLENGSAASLTSAVYSKFYGWVGKTDDALSRHPVAIVLYRDKAKDLYQARKALAARQGREIDASDIEAIQHGARMYAKKTVGRILFEIGATTEATHFLRFVSPFFGAWQEALVRWGRIVAKDPSVLRRFQLVFDAPRRLGLTVDANGNPVEPGDPINDDHFVQIQAPEDWGKDWAPFGGRLKWSEASANLVFQGGGLLNPGFGPWIQIPTNALAIHQADKIMLDEDGNPNNEWARMFEAILPLGPNKDILGPLKPPLYKYLGGAIKAQLGIHSQEWRQYEAMVSMELQVEFRKQYGRPPNRQETADILHEAGQKAKYMLLLKGLTSATAPIATQIESKFAPQIQAYRKLEDIARQQDKPYMWAPQQFLRKFGDAFYPLMESSTRNLTGIESTAGAVAQIKRHRKLIGQVSPESVRMIVGHAQEGPYSPYSRAWLTKSTVTPGSSETFVSYADPAEAMKDTTISEGWYDYNRMVNRLNLEANRLGFKSYVEVPGLVDKKRKMQEVLGKRNPIWWQEFNTFNAVQYDSRVADMWLIAKDPDLKSDPIRTDVFALQNYLVLRESVKRELARRERMGLSGSPEAQTNQDLVIGFTRAVSALVESNTYFEQYMYNGAIEFDPYLADNLTQAEVA